MTGTGNDGQPGTQKSRSALQRGLWNVAMERYAPKNPTGRLIFEMGILLGFFLVLGLLVKLAQG